MTTPSATDRQPPPPATPKLWSSFLLLYAVLVLAFPAFAWYGHAHSGNNGVMAAAVAGLICGLGASIALALTGLARAPQQAVSGTLLGMLFRMGLPLGAGLVLQNQAGPLASAGIFGMIVTYYLVALVAETLLSLRHVAPSKVEPKSTGSSEVS